MGSLALPAASASWTWTYDQRRDVLDENYYTGYLTWNSGKGGIAWSTGAATAPFGGLDPSAVGQAQHVFSTQVGWTVRTHAGEDDVGGVPMTPYASFTSAPIERDLHLNVSRGIMMDIYMRECEDLQAELYVGETLLAGQLAASSAMADGKFINSPPKPGLCGEPFGMQSEMAILPAGTVITLRLYAPTAGSTAPPEIAMSDASVIHIPLFPPEEMPFRYPSQSADDESSQEPPATSALGLAAIPVGLLALAGRRRRPLAAGLLLLLPIMSGCLSAVGSDGPSSEEERGDTGGSANITLVDDPGGVAGNGSILGRVFDEFHRPVAGVHISILRTNFFTSSTAAGRFEFRDVGAGTYTLRAVKETFKAFEVEVSVTDKKITQVDIAMEPLVKRSGGGAEHTHDYWGPEETERVVHEGEVVLQSCVDGYLFPLLTTNGICLVMFTIPFGDPSAPNLILPGTYDVVVTVTWPSTNQVKEAGIGFIANDNNSLFLMYPRESGVPTHIRTAWGMSDQGHQVFSMWQFYLYIPKNTGGIGARASAQVAPDPFDVKVSIVKGTVPLEPAHADFWGNQTSLTVLEKTQCCNWRPKSIVPPGTAWLEIIQEQNRVPDDERVIAVHPADQPPTSWDKYKALAPAEKTETRIVYRYDVGPTEADPFYAKRSNWDFAERRTGDPVKQQQDTLGTYTKGTYLETLTVIAHKDPDYNLENA